MFYLIHLKISLLGLIFKNDLLTLKSFMTFLFLKKLNVEIHLVRMMLENPFISHQMNLNPRVLKQSNKTLLNFSSKYLLNLVVLFQSFLSRNRIETKPVVACEVFSMTQSFCCDNLILRYVWRHIFSRLEESWFVSTTSIKIFYNLLKT